MSSIISLNNYYLVDTIIKQEHVILQTLEACKITCRNNL
jgi:hypothetical protein